MEGKHLEMVVRPCKGGEVVFGLTGQSASVYARKHSLCTSPYQDEKLGRGLRWHNVSGKEAGSPRCTVCGSGNGIVRP